MKILILLLLPFALFSQSISEKELKNIHKEYSSGLTDNVVTIGYYSNGEFTLKTLRNKSKEFQKTDLGTNSIYQIGSLSKVFVAHALCDLVVQEELKFSNTVKEHLPYVQFSDTSLANITLLELANHTSGLPRLPMNLLVTIEDTLQPYENYTSKNMIQFIASYKISRKPGTSYEYSNLGYGLLGFILDEYLKKNNGIDLEQYIQKNIFAPVEMTNTVITLDQKSKSKLLPTYKINEEMPPWKFKVMKWAGAYYSTIPDLSKYLEQFIVDEPIFNTEVLDILTEVTQNVNDNLQMAIGWHILNRNEEEVVWHNGGTFGNSAFMGFNTNEPLGVVALSNNNKVIDMLAIKILRRLYD